MMSVVWEDNSAAQTVRTIHTNTGASGILTNLRALSQAVPRQTWEGTVVNSSSTAGTGDYISASQVATLQFVDASGFIARLTLPAPDASIFLSDGVSVDSSAISSLIAACVGTLLTAAGNPVVAFVGGQLGPGRVNLP